MYCDIVKTEAKLGTSQPPKNGLGQSKIVNRMKDKHIIFVAIARLQVEFFLKVMEEYDKGTSIKSTLLHFYEPADKKLRRARVNSINGFKYFRDKTSQVNPDADFSQEIHHQAKVYKIKSAEKLQIRYGKLLYSVKKALAESNIDLSRCLFVMETGAFLSNQVVFSICKNSPAEFVLLEPSFFSGRFHCVKNSLLAPKLEQRSHTLNNEEFQKFNDKVASIKSTLAPVVPTKDVEFFSLPATQIFKLKNVVSFLRKLYSKYISNHEEEFSFILPYAFGYVARSIDSLRLKRKYSKKPVNKFIYYPLHVPADFALTTRSPEYEDQIATLKKLAEQVGEDYDLVIKEHPARVGAIKYSEISKLLDECPSIKLVAPSLNNYQLCRGASFVITVNSKAGLEGALMGTQVFLLGSAFYEEAPNVQRLEKLEDLWPKILEANSVERIEFSEAHMGFLQRLWASTHVGEIYDIDSVNISNFASALEKELA